jgi:hypothetical protein
MTRRYSGEVTVYITWLDATEQYGAKVKPPGEPSVYIAVGAPRLLEHAVDSPPAYDAAAKAALAFAEDEVPGVTERAAYKEDGYFVSRSQERRWPCPH